MQDPRRQASARLSPRHLCLLLAFLWLALLTCLTYSNALNGEFVFDDVGNIVERSALEDLGGVARAFFRTPWLPGRQVGNLTLALERRIHGLEVPGYHAFNIGIHFLNGLLLFLLVRQLSRAGRASAPGNATQPAPERGLEAVNTSLPPPEWAAWAVASLFIAHPLLTGCVNYVSQRSLELLTLFSLLAVLAHAQMRQAPARARWGWQVVALVCFWLAIRSKPVGLTLPVLWLLYDWLTGLARVTADGTGAPQKNRRALPSRTTRSIVLILLIAWAAIFLLQRRLLNSGMSLYRDTSPLPALWTQFQAEARATVAYWAMLFAPLPRWLNIDHDFAAVSQDAPQALLALLMHGILLGLAWRWAKQGRVMIAFGIGWFYITLAPYFFWPEPDILVDYKAYLPAIGAAVFVAGWMLEVAERPRLSRWITWTVLVLITLGIWQSRARNQVFRSELTLWQDAAEKSPGKARPHINLGIALLNAGRKTEAHHCFRQAMTVAPASAPARLNVAKMLREEGKLEAAATMYRSALELQPDLPSAHEDLASIYLEQGRTEAAVRELEAEITESGGGAESWYRLAMAYSRLQQSEAAELALTRATELEPTLVPAQIDLGKLLMERGALDSARMHLEQACSLAPHSVPAHYNLGLVLLRQHQPEAALRSLLEVAKQRTGDPDLLNNLGVAYAQVGRNDDSLRFLQQALTLDPHHPDAQRNYKLMMDRNR